MDNTMIFNTVLGIIGVVITSFLIPLLKKKIDAEEITKILTLIDIAVKAAEQIYREAGQGKFKKEYVRKYLKEHGINLSQKDLDAMVESSVFEMNKWKEEIYNCEDVGGTE